MNTGKRKLLLLLIDAFGISPTWKGNSILSANPQNIFNVWNESKRFLIDNDFYANDFYNQRLIHAVLSTGRNHLSDKKFIDEIIKDKTVFSAFGLSETYDQAARRTSSLHFVGFLPKKKSSKYSDREQIVSFIKHARSQGIQNIYLHLFLDESLEQSEAVEALSSLERALNEVKAGEIVTIAGSNSLKNENIKETIKSLVVGTGKKVLSPGQALAKYLKGSPADLEPVIIMSKNQPIGRFNDFDIVFYFNFTPSDLEAAITNYLSLDYIKDLFRTVKVPRFLNFLTLFNRPEIEEKSRHLASRNFGPTIVEAISDAGHSQVEIADASRVDHFLTYFNNSTTPKGLERLFLPLDDHLNALNQIVKSTKYILSQNQFDVVYSEVSILDHLAKTGQFREAIKAVNKLDLAIEELRQLACANNYEMIVLSNHGGAEKMADLGDIERLNQKTLSPIPLIFANSKVSERKMVGKNIHDQFMYDMMNKRHKLVDFAPTVLGLLGVEKLKFMEGNNLLN